MAQTFYKGNISTLTERETYTPTLCPEQTLNKGNDHTSKAVPDDEVIYAQIISLRKSQFNNHVKFFISDL